MVANLTIKNQFDNIKRVYFIKKITSLLDYYEISYKKISYPNLSWQKQINYLNKLKRIAKYHKIPIFWNSMFKTEEFEEIFNTYKHLR